ncbi:hypothetical protein TPHA_0P00980 [Tetrapisispora phaffii CBS 4417]|uniref:Glycosyltransferase family 15 protein n=1 Tax=Tetrapisispora phaffii (strain ATCC 24235 / CBS 4417 / NBRC 1672 / NRRL Y-8282 / UCD 70-5) TaxID=1071381 RepID=G8C278_TETPH|nr:hypothetical protein TPHA_0P00980 [Tetrapisispora phaffii CBS 4417]CCE66256.1 hypothetical protein TPHA_0P00980 [Tetrapisispora phaffii CBS 4417]
MDYKRMLYPAGNSREGTYKFFCGVGVMMLLIYVLIDNLPALVRRDDAGVGHYSHYFGKSFYSSHDDDDEPEYVYPGRVKYNYYDGPKEDACLVMVTKNEELYDVLLTVKNVEDRFNLKYNYDWVFVNNIPFSEDFKFVIGEMVTGKVYFSTIPNKHWDVPAAVDKKKALDARVQQVSAQVSRAGQLKLRQLWRYMSGYFHWDPVFDQYKYYWIIEPDMKLTCDVNYDVFKFMKDNNKQYGFFHSRKTQTAAVKSLWPAVTEFMSANPEMLAQDNMLRFISDDEGKSYNMCGFESSIEIGSFEFFRSKEYQVLFQNLDARNGWFYERWTASDFRAVAASLLLNKDQLHHFGDFGYNHKLSKYTMEAVCPLDKQMRLENKCACNAYNAMSWTSNSCLPKFYDIQERIKPDRWKGMQAI